MDTKAKNGYTIAEQRQIAKRDVIAEDTSKLTACPRCEGILKWGEDSRLDDLVSCVYCGWRPSARMEMKL